MLPLTGHRRAVSTGGKARGEHMADLGDSHHLVAMICYIEAFQHYVAGLLPVRVKPGQCVRQAGDLVKLTCAVTTKVVFCRRQSAPWPAISKKDGEECFLLIVILTAGWQDDNCWLFFNDLPGMDGFLSDSPVQSSTNVDLQRTSGASLQRFGVRILLES